MSHLQYEEMKCTYLQYEEKVVQCEEKVHSISGKTGCLV